MNRICENALLSACVKISAAPRIPRYHQKLPVSAIVAPRLPISLPRLYASLSFLVEGRRILDASATVVSLIKISFKFFSLASASCFLYQMRYSTTSVPSSSKAEISTKGVTCLTTMPSSTYFSTPRKRAASPAPEMMQSTLASASSPATMAAHSVICFTLLGPKRNKLKPTTSA